MIKLLILILSLFIFECQIEKEENYLIPEDTEGWGEEEGGIEYMGTKDYAQEGTPGFSYTGSAPHSTFFPLAYMNDDDDNSWHGKLWIANGIGVQSGTWMHEVVTAISRFIQEIRFVTLFSSWSSNPPAEYGAIGFKLQYYNGAWQTLHTQPLVTTFSEGKTIRSYTNGGLGFENVSRIRVWTEWLTARAAGAGSSTTNAIYSLNLTSDYFPDSGLRFKTNDGQIEIGKDTALGTNKLRFYDGSDIVALPLQTPGSRYASNIRVYDGFDVKALTEAFY